MDETKSKVTADNEKVEDTAVKEEKPERTFTRAEVGKMVNAQVSQEREKLTAAFDEKLADAIAKERSEWEAEQKMTAEQLAEKQRQAAEKQLAEKTAQVERRERLLNAKDKLSAKQLPLDLAEVLVGKTDEETDLKINQFQQAVDQQLQNEIHKRTASNSVPKTGTTVPQQTGHKDLAKMNYAEMKEYLANQQEQ